MNLKLKNPIVFIDIESTGLSVSEDRIIEICILKVNLDGSEEVKTLRINPEKPISAEAEAVHGISIDDLKDCPTFKTVAKSLAKFMEGCDIGGYNSNKFDIPILSEEFLRADVDIDLKKRKFVDVQTIFHKMEKRNLEAAYKFYCEKDLANAHSAEADVRATYEVLKSQLDRYSDLENDIEKLSTFSSFNRNVDFAGRIVLDDKDQEIFNFGKHKGRRVEEVLETDGGFYGWMMQADFPLDTKRTLTAIKLRKLNPKK